MDINENRKNFGRNSWAMLHSMGGCFNVSEMIDDGNINKFLSSFAEIYPCKKCKSHFKKYVIDYPFRGNSGSDLNQYFCAFHNEVNKRLKKPLYNCKLIY